MSKKLKTLLVRLIASAFALAATASHALPVPGKGTWELTLEARDLNGDGQTDAFFDKTLNITWLSTAGSGPWTWFQAKEWASQSRFGIDGWRLPKQLDTGTPGCEALAYGGTDCGYNVLTKEGDTVFSEMAHLFHVTLGNGSICAYGDSTCSVPPPNFFNRNTGNFQGMLEPFLWSGTEDASDPRKAWMFVNVGLAQRPEDKSYSGLALALAVHDGDVAAVPEPQSYLLLLAGLGFVAGAARRRIKAQ